MHRWLSDGSEAWFQGRRSQKTGPECKECGECALLLGRARALRVLIRSARLGKIAAPCSHNELRTLLAVGLHVNYPETALTGQICGVIPNGVLVADIACHVGSNRVYLFQR